MHAEGRHCRLHEHAVERGGDRETHGSQAGLREPPLHLLDRGHGPAQHRLRRAVVVGHRHAGRPVGHPGAQRRRIGRHRDHRARLARAGHQLAAEPRGAQEVARVDRTGRVQRGQLAEAVSGGTGRPHAGGTQHGQERQAVRAHGGLRPLGRGEPQCLRPAFVVGRRGRREHHVVQSGARRPTARRPHRPRRAAPARKPWPRRRPCPTYWLPCPGNRKASPSGAGPEPRRTPAGSSPPPRQRGRCRPERESELRRRPR